MLFLRVCLCSSLVKEDDEVEMATALSEEEQERVIKKISQYINKTRRDSKDVIQESHEYLGEDSKAEDSFYSTVDDLGEGRAYKVIVEEVEEMFYSTVEESKDNTNVKDGSKKEEGNSEEDTKEEENVTKESTTTKEDIREVKDNSKKEEGIEVRDSEKKETKDENTQDENIKIENTKIENIKNENDKAEISKDVKSENVREADDGKLCRGESEEERNNQEIKRDMNELINLPGIKDEDKNLTMEKRVWVATSNLINVGESSTGLNVMEEIMTSESMSISEESNTSLEIIVEEIIGEDDSNKRLKAEHDTLLDNSKECEWGNLLKVEEMIEVEESPPPLHDFSEDEEPLAFPSQVADSFNFPSYPNEEGSFFYEVNHVEDINSTFSYEVLRDTVFETISIGNHLLKDCETNELNLTSFLSTYFIPSNSSVVLSDCISYLLNFTIPLKDKLNNLTSFVKSRLVGMELEELFVSLDVFFSYGFYSSLPEELKEEYKTLILLFEEDVEGKVVFNSLLEFIKTV